MNYRRVKKTKEIINYPVNRYNCNVVINGRLFSELKISQYYKTKKGRSTVSDDRIQKLVLELQKKNKKFRKNKNDYYDYEPLYIDYRAYNLVWDYDDEEKSINKFLIIDCYREKKYDKK